MGAEEVFFSCLPDKEDVQACCSGKLQNPLRSKIPACFVHIYIFPANLLLLSSAVRPLPLLRLRPRLIPTMATATPESMVDMA